MNNATLAAQFQVAGVRFYKYKDAELQVGDPLTLAAEPENPYDPNAIKVSKGHIQIGHVPKVQTHLIHPLLKDTSNLQVMISYLDLTAKYPVVIVACIQ